MNTRFAARKFVASLFVFLVGLFLCVSLAHAQAVTGNISGTVTDASGAVIVGAQVVVTNTGTGVALTTTSNDQGRYNVPDLTVGTYQVQATKSGFQTVVHKGINLTVGSQFVADLSLPVGQAQETVTVESAVSQVETQSTAISTLVNQSQMVDLPLNGRNFEQLINVAPGVTPVGGSAGSLYGNGDSFSIAGARTEGEEFLLDDTNTSDFWTHQAGSGALGTSLGIEAIQEFSLLTNTYSAQFGGNGAVVNAVSKSGTNSLHGSGYEFLRNSALDSRSYFDLVAGAGGVYSPDKPEFRRNQFGGSLGGPIKKNKLFFFVNYEGLRQALGESLTSVGIPEPYVASDELPCGTPGAPTTAPIYPGGPLGPNLINSNPAAGCAALTSSGTNWSAVSGFETGSNPIEPEVAFGSGAGAQSAAAATAVTGILGLYGKIPVPAGAVDQGGYFFTATNASQTQSENYVLGRIDYTLSSNDSVFGRYVSDRANSLSPFPDFGSSLPFWPEQDQTKNQYFTLEERHIFSTNVVNQARFTFVRTYENAFTVGGTNPDPLNYFPSRHEDAFVIPCGTCAGVGASQFDSDLITQNTFGAGDDVAWNHGAHTITFGADIMRVQSNVYAPFMYGGFYIFSSLDGFVKGSPLLGYAVQNSPYTDIPNRYFREIDINPYINDSWKINSRLTLNIGLRYEYGTNPSGTPLYTVLNPPYGDGAFAPVSHVFQTSPNRKNIDPRVGLAWAPFGDQKTSIRAGFGMFHDPVAPRTYASAYYFNPPFSYHFLLPEPFPNPFLGAPAALPPNEEPTGCAMDNLANNQNYCTTLGDGVPYTTNEAPYQEQWNLNVQRALGAGTILSVAYVGSRGVHLFSQRNLNPVDSKHVC